MTSQIFGPFQIEEHQIVALKTNFTKFMNELLRCELALNNSSDAVLTITSSENVGDGGVDAHIEFFRGSNWIPQGASSWQFKQSDFEPAEIEKEIRDATHAQAKIREGSHYLMVLGASLNHLQMTRRIDKLKEVVLELQLIEKTELALKLNIFNAGNIAIWASHFPALAVNPMLSGHGARGRNFATWADTREHARTWVISPDRSTLIENIRRLLSEPQNPFIKVYGKKSAGKSRTVLEALRDQEYESFVIYIDASEIDSALFSNLSSRERKAILVADNANAIEEKRIRGLIPRESLIKVVLIRTEDNSINSDGDIWIPELGPDLTSTVIGVPRLTQDGFISYAANLQTDDVEFGLWVSTHQLINQFSTRPPITEYIENFLAAELSGERELEILGFLSLFTRIGWDDELENEISVLADVLNVPLDNFWELSRKLETLEVIKSEGRFRKIVPFVVACKLAEDCWKAHGDFILERLIPKLSGSMEIRFYRRVAELEVSRQILRSIEILLSASSPLSTIRDISENNSSELLPEIAKIAPFLVAPHIAKVIRRAGDDELRSLVGIRRELVEALSKLVWNYSYFTISANALLKLALNENESWSNNATGIWLDLFHPTIPPTFVPPGKRMDYLKRKSKSPNIEIVRLSIQGIKRALDRYAAVVSVGQDLSEEQLEHRGGPKTYGELYHFQGRALNLLANLLVHRDERIANEALAVLVEVIHPLSEIPSLRSKLVRIINNLNSSDVTRAVTLEIRHLMSIFGQYEGDSRYQMEGLHELLNQMPALTELDQLAILVGSKTWDFEEGLLAKEIEAILRSIDPFVRDVYLVQILKTENLSAAFDLGVALSALGFDLLTNQIFLDKVIARNINVLRGFLLNGVRRGNESIFDNFFDSESGRNISPENQYFISMVAPYSEQGWIRVQTLARSLPVFFGATFGVGWIRHLSEIQIGELISEWVNRVEDQDSYNSLVDYASLAFYDKSDCSGKMQELLWDLLSARTRFPELGQKDWAWGRVARLLLPKYSEEIAIIIIDLICSGAIAPHPSSEDSVILQKCASAQPRVALNYLGQKLVEDSWRLTLVIRGWLTSSIPSEAFIEWIDSNIDRARIVSSICLVASDTLLPLVEFLLVSFPGDEEIASNLFSTYWSGSWVGNNSDRLQGKIDQLNGWLLDENIAPAVVSWVQKAIDSLSRERVTALSQEEERV